MATVASLCNVAQIAVMTERTPQVQNEKGSPALVNRGKPTEIALALFATALGMRKDKILGTSSSSNGTFVSEPNGLSADLSRSSGPIKEKNDVRIRSVEFVSSTPTAYVERGEYPFHGTIKRMTSVYRPTTYSPHSTDKVGRTYFMKDPVE
ncbi:hypothetical protein A4X13_0g6757 [Tilletia indica]|uniref:Uncharacterized protein n=1 Tax=Tilletia indica TaxID=43049 RepID=A0A177T616_9BASI|nr:hypothetical protein A4X13_0g6757 [Tilletia indica]